MNNILKNNISSIILLASVAVGAAFGAIFGEKARVVAPIGQIFMNLLFTLVVPVVFFSVSSSICNMKKNGIMGKTMGRIILVFLGMSIIAAIVGYILMLLISPIEDLDRSYILSVVKIGEIHDPVSAGDTLVHALTSDDFFSLFSKSNLLPLIVFAVLFGVGTAMAGADRIAGLLQQGMDVTIKMMNVVMMLAPVGLGCYFADTIASVGSQIIGGYLRVFIIFAIIAVVFFFVVNSLYVFLASGREGLSAYWKYIIPPSITAMASASSTVAMPANIEAAKMMGVTPAIAETAIPLGTTLHKDGCVLSGVIKVVFIMVLFGHSLADPLSALVIIGLGLLSGIVAGAIPSGGATAEILICTLLGLQPSFAGILIIIGTIVDIPSTLINSSSNVVGAVVIDALGRKRG